MSGCTPGELTESFLFRITTSLTAQGRAEIENIPGEGRNTNVRSRRGQVESELVYPLLRGRDVSAWRAEPTRFIIVPHYPDHFDEVISDVDLSSRGAFPLAGAWLRQFRTILRHRHPPPNRAWDMEGEDWCRIEGPMNYIRGRNIVVVREIQGRPAAAVVEQRFVRSLGRSAAPLPDHKLLFCSVPTLDEAIYLLPLLIRHQHKISLPASLIDGSNPARPKNASHSRFRQRPS